jgi:hypothetical protein
MGTAHAAATVHGLCGPALRRGKYGALHHEYADKKCRYDTHFFTYYQIYNINTEYTRGLLRKRK